MTHGSVSMLRRVFALLVLMSLFSLATAAPSAPVLTSLATTTTSNPETVTGTATAGIEVRLYVNGVLMELTSAQPDGSFSTKIPLFDGSNTVHATAWDGTEESVASNTLASTYTNTLPRTQGGTISVDTVWTPAGGAYQLTSNLTIAAGVEFRLMPGVEVRADSAKTIDVNGLLIAHGTAASTVALRSSSASPNKNSWIGLRINATGYVDFDYALIEHATNAMQFLGGEGVVKHTTLRTSDTGVRVQADSSPSFTAGFEISGNNYGVVATGNNIEAQNPLPVFTGGSIKDSYYYNYQTASFGNGGAVVLNATSNWWGSTDVAVIASKISDNSDSTALPTVDFSRYLGAAGGAPAHSGEFLFGTVSNNRTLTAGDYQILGNVRIAAGVSLTVPPGTTIRAPSPTYGSFAIDVYGTLSAQGTAAAPILFRSAEAPAPNRWHGIRVWSTGFADLDYAIVESASNGLYFDGGEGSIRHTTLRTNGTGARILANSSPSFTQGFVIGYNNYGVVVTGNGVEAQNPAPVFNGGEIRNSYYANFQTETFGNGGAAVLNATDNWWGSADVALIASKIVDNSDNASLPSVDFSRYLNAAGGTPAHSGGFLFGAVNANRTVPTGDYQILGNVRVAAGVTLTVAPGTTIRAPSPTYGSYAIDVYGTLTAQGTAAAPILFRSADAPAVNRWAGIRVWTTGWVDLDYAIVEAATNGLYFDGGEGSIRHTTLRTNGTGTRILADSSPSFTQGFVIGYNTYGVVVTGNGNAVQNPAPVFSGGEIRNSTNANFQTETFGNGAAVVLNATDNWWGSADVALIASKIVDHNDNSSLPTVDFSRYLGAPGGTPAHTGGFLFGSVTANRTLAAGDYQMLGHLRIAAGVTLTAEPGVTMRVPAGTYGAYLIEVNGTLVAHGTAAAPVVFRSGAASPTKNSWTGLRINTTGYVDFDYALVEHATYAMQFLGGAGIVKHTTLRTSGTGVSVQANSSPSFSEGFDISGNSYGVVVTGNGIEAQNPLPVFTGGAIRDSTYRNYQTESFGNGGAVGLNARNNWWGTVDTGAVRTSIADREDQATLPKVDFLDYLESLGGPSYVTAFDVAFVRRDVNALTGTTSRTEMMFNTAADAVFEIRHEDTDTVVRSVAVSGLARGPNSFEWNGRKDDGTFAQDGLYRLVPRLSKDGRNWSLDASVPAGEGDGTGTIPVRFNPHRNELWKMEYQHRSGFAGVVMMTATPPGGTPFMPLPLRLIAAGSFQTPTKEWYYWDGRDAQGRLVDGTWEMYFESPRYPRPHYLQLSGTRPLITGNRPPPTIEVKADPYLVVHSYEQLSRFVFRVSLDSVVTVKLLPPGIVDPTSPQAIVLLSNQTLAAKDAQGNPVDHPVEWRGHETNDINRMRTTPEGSYTFSIEARSVQTQGTALYRGVLQLFQ